MPPLRPVILSGGSGTRLWPISTPDRPKQFVPLGEGRSLFSMTLSRLDGISGVAEPIVVSGEKHRDLVRHELEAAGQTAEAVILEPVARNTAPAVVAAALRAASHDVLVILPSDHRISDLAAFRGSLGCAVELATSGRIVVFGVVPQRAETGFGYVETGEDLGSGFSMKSFVEKPVPSLAEQFAKSGTHLWNSGMFVAMAWVVLEEASQLCPDLLRRVEASMPDDGSDLLGEPFGDVEPISFDHAILEHTSKGALVPLDAGWSDLGSYRALLEASDRDENGNHISGPVTARRVKNSYLRSDSQELAVADLDDVVVVATSDNVLVIPVGHSQAVRELAVGVGSS